MSFQKIYEIYCNNCLTVLKHVYSIEEAKQTIQENGWLNTSITLPDHSNENGAGTKRERYHFCSESCRDEMKQELQSRADLIRGEA